MRRLSIALTAVLLATAVYADVIYDDQTYDFVYLANGLSIYGALNYESADDFIPDDDVTVNEIVIWLSGQNIDLRVDWFEGSSSGPGDDPPADFFSEEVPSGEITWEDIGGWWPPVIKATVPITNVNLTAGETYWLGFQNTTGSNTFWWAFDYGEMGGPYWEQTYFYYTSYWTVGQAVFGSPYDHFYELHGSLTEHEDPTITDMHPVDDDFPSGVPPSENTSGCHWQDGDPEANEGIDVEASSFDVYDAGMDLVLGVLTIDDSDLWDVIVDFEADDPWEEGVTYTVETETYDLAGNGPVIEELGTIKAGYR
jgi:hypothetical protein